MKGTLLLAGLLGSLGSAQAIDLPPSADPITLPNPAANAYGVSYAFGPSDGLMYVWDGESVLKQNGNTFTTLGQFNAAPPNSTNSADAGPIAFSLLGDQLLFGNGGGGSQEGQFNGRVFSIPVSGADFSTPVGTVPFHSSFLPDPVGGSDTKYFVDQATDKYGTASSVSIFDASTGQNVPVIQNIPGASTSMAIDAGGRLYVGVGYGPPHTGELHSFALSDLVAAASSATPLPWGAGQVFNTAENNQGSGLFFAHGLLFAGGGQGVTVFDAQGNSTFYDNHGYTTVTYDAFHDRILVAGFGDQEGFYPASSFVVPEPSTAALATAASLLLIPLARRRRRR